MTVTEFTGLIIMAIIVISLLSFAKRLHDVTTQLQANVEVDRVNVDRLEATVNRMEAADRVVAKNLASSVSRADATEGPEGAAADAALRTGDTAEAIHARQDRAQ